LLVRLFLALGAAGLSFAAEKPVDFNRDVRPIFSDNCFACHGPDDKHRMANLRLDTEDGLFADRGSYKIVVPGDASKSRILARISAANRSARMPPPQAGVTLTEAQIDMVRKWIEQGARWERHWAFVAPQPPALPAVRNSTWPRNPIDRLVLARLEREGLKPAPEADRATLLRRLSFDLTGLPPTPAEVDAFMADQSAGAYGKQVDRLLALPQYGERMAMQWLDLARYADTHGYHIDSQRDMWKWRDWVIDAFNSNMPFDRFGIEQLAGDLLPNATVQQKLASGFNRNHMINYEGGAIPEEYQVEYVADRVDTTANVFMGLTLGCARCHDHKYDPILQKDYYRFFAFFNTIAEKGLDGKNGNAAPILEMPTAAQASEVAWLQQAIADHEAALPEKETQPLLAAWEKTRLATLPEPPRDGLLAHYELDGNQHDGRTINGSVSFGEGRPGQAASFNGEAHVEFPAFQAERFAVAFWMRSGAMPEMTVLEGGPGFEIGVEESHPQPDFKRGSPLYVEFEGRRWHSSAIVFGGQWHHVAVNLERGNFESGKPGLILDGKPAALAEVGPAAARTSGPMAIGDPHHDKPFKGDAGGLRIYDHPLGPAEAEALALHEPIRFILAQEESKRSKEQKQRLLDYFLTYDAPADVRLAYRELNSLKERLAQLKNQIPSVQVMAEMARPRETFILGRGDYRNPGAKVTPAVPALFPPLPRDAPANRLGLAEWLFSPQHPLTARVAVNRYWQLYFGIGLVKTAEDFGSQGDAPVERELLDWLACEFRKTWDVKALQRLIVTSATYRQASQVSPELLEKDPENRLLGRGPRFRLPAEMVRDNALAASRLLNREIGGPSVFPYQPPGLWEELSRGETFTAQEYHESQGPDLYRRSMYTFWKRTTPPAALTTFDAPDREKCTSRRLITNTPLQALVLLNDPTYVEAARVLAQRAILEAGSDPQARLRFLFRAATARRPALPEMRLLLDLAQRSLDHYRKDPAQAASLIAVGASKPANVETTELAAWTIVASTILNLDETVTKE
jgi:mono/diheme cytochrome c family protein